MHQSQPKIARRWRLYSGCALERSPGARTLTPEQPLPTVRRRTLGEKNLLQRFPLSCGRVCPPSFLETDFVQISGREKPIFGTHSGWFLSLAATRLTCSPPRFELPLLFPALSALFSLIFPELITATTVQMWSCSWYHCRCCRVRVSLVSG